MEPAEKSVYKDVNSFFKSFRFELFSFRFESTFQKINFFEDRVTAGIRSLY